MKEHVLAKAGIYIKVFIELLIGIMKSCIVIPDTPCHFGFRRDLRVRPSLPYQSSLPFQCHFRFWRHFRFSRHSRASGNLATDQLPS